MQEKINHAKELIKEYFNKYGSSMFVGTSGGKDSVVIQHLVQSVVPEVEMVHTPKDSTKTHPATANFLYYETCQHNLVHFVPKERMQSFIERSGFKLQVDGSRRDEYNRTDRSDNYVVNGQDVNRKEMPEYVENGLFGLSFLYPIVDWSDDEVWEYIHKNKIPYSREYVIGY